MEIALIRLLPRLQATDDSLLNEAHRNHLHRALGGKNIELILAILKAYEQVGDGEALSYVERLAIGDRRVARKKRVHEAAWSCLLFLEERAKKERIALTLLRPASAPGLPAEVLLRPAQGVSEIDSELLLHPSTSEDRT